MYVFPHVLYGVESHHGLGGPSACMDFISSLPAFFSPWQIPQLLRFSSTLFCAQRFLLGLGAGLLGKPLSKQHCPLRFVIFLLAPILPSLSFLALQN